MTTLGNRIASDPDRFTSPPDDDSANTSLQPLGDARVLVEYVLEAGCVEIRGAWVEGELVDECEFAVTRVLFWQAAIQCELDQERAEAEW